MSLIVSYLLFLVAVLGHHHTNSEKASKETACCSTSQHLASPQRLDLFGPTATPIVFTPAFCTSFCRSCVYCFVSEEPTGTRYYVEPTLEVWSVQTSSQGSCRILPKLRRSLDDDSGQGPTHWTQGFSTGLELEQLGVGRKSPNPKTKTTFCIETKVDFTESIAKGEGERKERWQSPGDRHGAKSICSIPHISDVGTLARTGDDSQCTLHIGDNTTAHEWRIDQCSQTGISRGIASRCARSRRQNQRQHVASIDARPAFCNNIAGACEESVPGSASCGDRASTSLAEAFKGSHQAMGRAVRSISEKAVAVPGIQTSCWSRSRSSTQTDSGTEFADCSKRLRNTSSRRNRREGGASGCTRRRRSKKGPPNYIGGMRRSNRCPIPSTSRGDTDTFGRRGEKGQCQTTQRRRWQRIFAALFVTFGRDLTCPAGIVCRQGPNETVQDAEAYVSYASCAASIRWHRIATMCGGDDTLHTLFADQWTAQRTATQLRGEVLSNESDYDWELPSKSRHAIAPKKKGMTVHFAKDATVHIIEETGPDISQAIPLQVDSLSSWSDKPWSLLPLEANHCRTPLGVETNNDSSGTAYVSCPVQHTPDSEVPVSGVIEWTNPLTGSTTASRYSEAIQEALYNNDLQHLTSIARVAQWTDRLHIKTYGHFEIDRGTKNLVIPVSQAHELHQQIAVLWHEWSNQQNIDIIPVVPQPDDMGIDLHLIVGHRTEHGHLMLVELRGEDPCRATVIVDRPVIAYDLIIKARGFLDDTASYITRKGGHIWQNFVPLPTSPGQYWTILQHRSDSDSLHLMQTETTILPAKPDRGHWHRKAELPDEYLNLLEESDMVPHQQPLVRGPMIFEREEEWTRLLTLARHTMEQTIQIIIHGLFGEDIGNHHGTAQRLSRTEIEAMVDLRWPMLESFVKRIFIVFPQPDGFLVSSVTFLVEFQDPNDIPHQDARPILEEVIRYQDESTYQTQRTALYLTTGSSFEHIVDGIPGCNPFEYDHRCDAWLGGIPVHLGDQPIIQDGQLLIVRLVPIDESPSEYLRAIFAGAANFEQFAIVASARLAMTELLWTFHLVGQMGEPHRTIVLNVPWIHSHSANYVVQQLRHTGQVAVDDADFSCTLVRKNPLDFASLEFVCGPQPDSHCTVLVGFTAKWDEQYLEHHCYNLPCHTTALDIAGIFRLDRFSEWTIFVSGRPVPPDDMLHLRPGEYLEIELEDTSDEEDDGIDLMQQPRPTVSPNLVSVRLLGTHSTSVQVNLRNDEPMMQQLREDWPLMGRIAADLHALHTVSHPPSFVTAPPNEVFLMQFHADASDQVHTDDVLILLTVSFSAPHSMVHNKQRIRVAWGPKKTTRDQFLSYVRMQRHCASATVLCTLFHNNGLWAIQDSSLRNLRDGDHLRLQIRSDKEGWCDFEYSEESARRIRIFADSPPAEQSEGSEGGESLSPYSVRSRSRERSRTPEDTNPGPPSPAELEDDPIEDTDSQSLLQVRATKQKRGRESQKILESHVLDRWCTLDQKVSTGTPKKILELDALIEKNKDEKHVAMTAIRIFAPVGTGLPEYLEIEETHDTIKVQRELVNWGHHHVHCTPLDWDGTPLGYAVTLAESSTQYLLLFLNPDTGEHFWSEQQEDDEISLLRTLGRFGQRRCVILDRHNSGQLQVVYFIDTTVKDPEQSEVQWHIVRIPQVSYPRPTQNKISQRIRLTDVDNTDCLLRAPTSNIGDIMNLFRANDFLQTSVAELSLPPKCLIATKNTTQRTNFDRLQIYVDGTSNPAYKHWEPALAEREGTPDAWAFVVVGETYGTNEDDSDYHFLGFATQPVCYDPEALAYIGADRIGSDVAEREAMFWAGMWRLTFDDTTPTIFLSDCTTAGQFAFGQCGTTEKGPALHHAMLRGVFQALETALTTDCVCLQHVRGHSGEVWNEFCDISAKWSAKTVHWLPRPHLDMRLLRGLIPTLWMYFADEHAGLPPITREGHFAVPPPDLPCQCETIKMPDTKHTKAHITLSVATANVQTLGRGPEGFQGKLHYLQEQFKALELHIVGIQEARTDECFSGRKADFLRLASGHDHGHLGTELWISRITPYAWTGQKPHYFQPRHLITIHKDPRRLIVRVTTQILDCIFAVLHGPQSGRPQEEREQWWDETTAMILKYQSLAPFVVLGDLNATTGPQDHRHVHCFDDDISKNTPLVLDCVQQADLTFVSTMSCHQGEHHTWISPDGQTSKRIDHILIPATWGTGCTYSTVLTEVDMGNGEGDHRAVGAMIQWSTSTMVSTGEKRAPTCHRHLIKGNQTIQRKLGHYQVPPWNCDINSQVIDLNQHIQAALTPETAQDDCHPRKKPFITDEIWWLRSRRNRLKKTQTYTTRALTKETLGQTFRAWKSTRTTGHPPDVAPPDRHFEVLLRCCKLKQGVELTLISRSIKQQLRDARANYVFDIIQAIPANSSSSQILTLLRPCIGTSNSRKRSRPGLPQVLTEEGEPCTTTNAACDRWIEYFSQMECGQRVTGQQLFDIWRANLESLRCDRFEESLTTLPSLFDMERSYRRVAVGKAVGQDAVPPELCNALPCAMARATFPQMMKLAIHGQEALIHKGGRLAVAYKRGPTNQCSSYRSLLVSSHVGKTIHRSLRQHQADLYESYLQGQQIGGRRKIPVGFALHLTRAHVRQHLAMGRSVGVIFLDLTEAFYRVIRPMALGGHIDDLTVATLTQRLGLDPGTLHDLHLTLREPSAVERANIPPLHQRYLRALHTDTHFQIGDQTDHVRTTAGTRPGDSFADVVFGYLWARVLKVLEDQLQQHGLLTHYPHVEEPGFYGNAGQRWTAFIGPTWCDDLSICLWAPTASEVEGKAGLTAGIVLDLCKQHGMTPNLGKGKTAILLGLQGAESRRLRRKYFGAKTASQMVVLGEHSTYQIEVVGEYKHLGGLIHAKGDMRREVSRRLAIAHAAFAQHRKVLYTNPAFTLQKRMQLFSTLVLTKLTYGMETWDLCDAITKQRLHVGIMRLYRRLLGGPHDAHLTDTDILMATGLPTPTVLLRQARLRYLGLLYISAPQELWSVIAGDLHWRVLIEDDIQWLWNQLKCSSPLLDPATGFDYWEYLMRRYPGYWKRLIRRGVLHSSLQDQKHWIVDRTHESFVKILEEFGTFPRELPKPTSCRTVSSATSDRFGCLHCEKSCKSAAGEAVHMQRKHGHNAKLRYLYDSTHCPACLREYHIPERVHQHLRTATTCRQTLLARGALPEPALGSGTKEHRLMEIQHNRLSPFLIGIGPQPCQQAEHEEEAYPEHFDEVLWDDIMHCIEDHPDLTDVQLLAEMTECVRAKPRSWTTLKCTVQAGLQEMEKHPPLQDEWMSRRLQTVGPLLLDVKCWPFLATHANLTNAEEGQWERYIAELVTHPTASWRNASVPRPFGRERYLLHFFSGRRRRGDLQYYLDKFHFSTVTLFTVSIDIVVDKDLGDLMRQSTRDFWLRAIRQRYVVAMIGGPPCETWSQARGQTMDGQKEGSGPRAVRDEKHPWGLPALGVGEVCQVNFGTTLLLFVLEAFCLLALMGGAALVEHPAEPTREGCASIWRLAITSFLLQLPGVGRLRVIQGLLGSESPKPTDLMHVGLPSLEARVKDHSVFPLTSKVSIGRDEFGRFRTTRLKEYPPALTRAMALAFAEAIDEMAVDHDFVQPHLGVEALIQAEFGDALGPDFAPKQSK